MAKYTEDISKTFSEYLLIPGLTRKDCTPSNVDLQVPLTSFKKGVENPLNLNIPFVSAIMQSVSDHNMAIALARNGGLSFIFGSQPIEEQSEMVRKVKNFKAGFVVSNANITPENTLQDVIDLKNKTGYSTMGVTHDGSPHGKLLGMVTSRDYRPTRDNMGTKVKEFMMPFEKLITGELGMSLNEANDKIWEHKLSTSTISKLGTSSKVTKK